MSCRSSTARVLESLREPLETRRRGDFARVAAGGISGALPAGRRHESLSLRIPRRASGRCRCAPPEIARYRARISGPLLDRIDLRVEVPAVPSEELLGEGRRAEAALTTAFAAQRVKRTRELQGSRAGKLNAELTGDEIQDVCRLDRRCRLLLAQARIEAESLGARCAPRAARGADHCRSCLHGSRDGRDATREKKRAPSGPFISPKPCSCGAHIRVTRYWFSSTM